MAPLTLLTTTTLLLAPLLATAAPFAAQEQCSCIPIGSVAPSNSSQATCEDIAAQLQSTRYQMRLMPYLSDLWVASGEVAHVKIPAEPPAPRLKHATQTLEAPERRRRARFGMPCLRGKPRRRTHSPAAPQAAQAAQAVVAVDADPATPAASEVQDPELPREDAFNIVCRTRGSQDAKQGIVFGVRPVPVVFILLAMVLACTTIIDWVVDAYQAYSARVRLEGEEKRIFAGEAAGREERVDAAEKREG